MIIAITGYPKAGKSTAGSIIAKRKGFKLISTDNYIDKFTFAETPIKLIEEMRGEKDYVIEGVAVSRMLKYGLGDTVWTPDQVFWVFGGEVKNPISKSTFNAFENWVKNSDKPYNIIWDLGEL